MQTNMKVRLGRAQKLADPGESATYLVMLKPRYKVGHRRGEARRGGQRHQLAVYAYRHTRGRPWHGVRLAQSILLGPRTST